MSTRTSGPIVEEVLRFEELPLGSLGTRRAVVRWSDGSESETFSWYADEVLSVKEICWDGHATSFGPCTSAGTATGCSRKNVFRYER